MYQVQIVNPTKLVPKFLQSSNSEIQEPKKQVYELGPSEWPTPLHTDSQPNVQQSHNTVHYRLSTVGIKWANFVEIKITSWGLAVPSSD